MFKRIHLSLSKFVARSVLVLFLSAIYLYAFPSPTLIYAGAVLLHAGLGLIAAVCLVFFCRRYMKNLSWTAKVGWLLLTVGALLGVVLIYLGTTRPMFRWLYLH